MSELTEDKRNELAKRLKSFDLFRKERLPVLHKFAEVLGCPGAHEILLMPEKFLPYISVYMEGQVVDVDSRVWLITRIGYFLGELLVSKFNGCWMVDERPGSDTFARYVVGDFSELDDKEKVVDPFVWAQAYVDSSVPRNLEEKLEELVMSLRSEKAT